MNKIKYKNCLKSFLINFLINFWHFSTKKFDNIVLISKILLFFLIVLKTKIWFIKIFLPLFIFSSFFHYFLQNLSFLTIQLLYFLLLQIFLFEIFFIIAPYYQQLRTIIISYILLKLRKICGCLKTATNIKH